MKLNDLNVGTQLRLGLGAILFFVALLATVAWVQTEEIWLQTEGLYSHPLTVRRALGELSVGIMAMHGDLKDLCLVESDRERETVAQDLDAREVHVQQQFAIIYASYLGPRRDIEEAERAFAEWKAIREETRRLLREGKTVEAISRERPGGVSDSHVEKIMREIKDVSDFATSRGDQFYRNAEAQKRSLSHQLGAVVAIILLLTLVIALYLLKGIKTPLTELTAAAEQLRQGKLDLRSRYASANEFGLLSDSFNAMADAMQTEMRIKENAAQFADVLLREEEVQAFCRELLKALLTQTGSQVGAVYFLNEAKTAFEHFESIGLGTGGRVAFSATALEGELGTALATRQIQRITDIPADTRFAFAAVSGEFTPREILTIPVLSEHSVSAVISLASVRAYDTPTVRLVNEIWSVLTARVNGVLAFRKIKDLAERLKHQNRELDSQKMELVAQAGEMTAQTQELSRQNTELEMQKRQLDESNRLKSAFLSNMSHELRTPLNSVIALSGVLSRRLANTIPAEEYGYLEIIERNGRNLLSLINDILDLSRIEAGREDISVSRFSVRELAGEIVAMLEAQAQEKKIALCNEVSAELPLITSDPAKIRHILQNLVGNAVKFTEQGQVTITARQTGNEIHVAVADTGIGIAADHLPHIFDEFRQADGSTSRKYGGTGLGLAIAKKYARLFGGSITVESTPGQGSTFTLRLPLALSLPGVQIAETEQPAVERPAGPVPAFASQAQSVLVVEDNEPAIIQLTDILQAQGYRVLVARNGQEALVRIEQTLPDAMILDLMMPEVDGFQLLKAIRGMERTANIPVLILTAKDVTKEELSVLKGNHIYQLIQKGDVNKTRLLAAVARMFAPPRVEPATPPPRLSPRRRFARPGKPVVLVVEDNPDNLRTAKALLDGRYQIIEASDGRSGVDQARAHQPDIILMDIAMPVMDGVQALQEIRRDETLRHTPVIAVTASAMKGDRETILAHGFDDYLSKPIDHDALEHVMRKWLD